MGFEMSIVLFDGNHNLETAQDDHHGVPIEGGHLRHVGEMAADHNQKRDLLASQAITQHCEKKRQLEKLAKKLQT